MRGASSLTAGVLLAGTLLVAGCGDGTPEFCGDLRRQADMTRLAAALEARDLGRARTESGRFAQLAAGAPTEVRPDLVAIAEGLGDVVDLLEQEQEGADPAALERRREELNDRLADLGSRSAAVTRWASAECGIEL